MAHRYGQPIAVTLGAGGLPASVRWRSEEYAIAEVFGMWRLMDRWWVQPVNPATHIYSLDRDAQDRTYCRICCRDPGGIQVFDLLHDAVTLLWVLDVAHNGAELARSHAQVRRVLAMLLHGKVVAHERGEDVERDALGLKRAGWHSMQRLRVPNHVHVLFLPPYSPELQPAEHLWPLTNTVLVNRHFASIEDLEDAQAARCVALQDRRDLVRSATLFHWWPQRLKKRQGPRRQ